MIEQGIQAFSGKRVLLLQGPIGPFFARLAFDLENANAQVFKVNFNAGDLFFFPKNAINYLGTVDAWPSFCENLIVELKIDAVLLFGDCRPIHQVAHSIATKYGIEIGVFEEGYLRPDYITLERFGVNGNSPFNKNLDLSRIDQQNVPPKLPVENSYWLMVGFGFLYFLIGSLGKPFFRHYIHHRPLSLFESFPWLRSAWRKWWYRWKERDVQSMLTTEFHQKYFLVPLQVFNDSQVTDHANFDNVEHFIETVFQSFLNHSPVDTLLVLKHHPMDRGYTDYTDLIKKLRLKNRISERVLYIHDQHLPTLLDSARGVVIINSTVGLSALHHGVATKVCGNAIYDIDGITCQGSLDEFWNVAQDKRPDSTLFKKFNALLTIQTQLNGSFYRPLANLHSRTGLKWTQQ